MTRIRFVSAFTLVALVVSSYALRADVRADQKTRVEFAGMLGRMMNLFGGKGAKDGMTSSVAVKGDRKATVNDTTGQIIDLAEEKVYDLDMRKKSYKVTTFADLRRKMQEAEKKAKDDARREEGKPQAAEPQKNEPQVEIDFDIKNTGQSRSVNGFDTKQSVVTVTVREKGKTLEQAGGLVMTTDLWLTKSIAAMKDVRDFDMRYAKALYGPMVADISAEQMATAMAMYPMMKQAMGKMSAEGSKIDGTPILTTVTMDTVKSEDQVAQEAKQSESSKQQDKSSGSGGLGGLVGGFAKRAAAKKMGGDEPAKPRMTFMTTTNEVLKVVTDVSAADVAVPEGFKENK